MKKFLIVVAILIAVVIVGSIIHENKAPQNITRNLKTNDLPKIASWCAKKDEIIKSGKPFDLVMTAWFEKKEARQIKKNNPDAILLAGLTGSWVWDNAGWMEFLDTVVNYGKSSPIKITEDMYLHKKNGERCAFGWASAEWNQEEIYSMDPRNEKWIEYITSFYKTVADQNFHDGIIVDMVVEKQYWCPDAISDTEWLSATKNIYKKFRDISNGKLIIFNAGKDLADIDEYKEYFDGYLMENFLGAQLKTTFEDGLKAAQDDLIVIYNVDTDDTGKKDLARMRLGLALSMLHDNTYFTYDFGPRDHGQAWWFPEYNVQLGSPLGSYYEENGAYRRDFERGSVVAAPNSNAEVQFDIEHTDVTTNKKNTRFNVNKGDARIFIK